MKIDKLKTDKDYINFIEKMTHDSNISLMDWQRLVLRILQIIIKVLHKRTMLENL